MEPNEQAPTKQVSLDDLKRAIAVLNEDWPVTAGICGPYEKARAEAWRTAFEWHAGLGARHSGNLRDGLGELAEGMRLIREKLR